MNGAGEGPSWPWLLASAAICGLAIAAASASNLSPRTEGLAPAFYTTAYLAGGWQAALAAFNNLRRFRFDIDFLMIAVALGAAFIDAWWEGATLLFLFSLSGALEAMAMARTDREIRSLFRETPKQALEVLADGSTQAVPVARLAVGMLIRILPGQQFPADAMVVSGESAADESTLTGESAEIEKKPGDTVFSGTLNSWGSLDARVLRPSADSAQARIIRLIREAQASKAPSQRFTDRFGTGYTVGILGLSLVMFLVWHLAMGVPAFSSEAEGRSAFYRAMTLLVVCSPCALVISIPSAILAGIASGARRGILFRGGVALENFATIDRLAMDKTGTLTRGELELVGIEANEPDGNDRLLSLAAALARSSTHPVSRAITSAALRTQVPSLRSTGFRSLAGEGLSGRIDGTDVTLGRRSMFSGHPWLSAMADPEPGLTEVLVEAGPLCGRLLLRDTLRPEAAGTVAAFRSRGVDVTMLTGDRKESAGLVARDLRLTDWQSDLKPEEKVGIIHGWRKNGERIAMAGDGVNDAPSLAAADVSIGMGLRGSDAVLEQADVVLTKDRLDRILEAHDLSRRCRAIIRQNLAVSLGVIVLLGLAAIGSVIPLTVGVLGHEGSTVIVVLNSLRLLLLKAPLDAAVTASASESALRPASSRA